MIRQTKFKKTRNVPLSPSACRNLQIYLEKRRRAGFSGAAESPIFVNLQGRCYGQAGFTTIFLEIIRKIGLRGPKGQPGPRIHDFRHSFAVNRLAAWYREGANLSAKLPILSTYLGHSTVSCTQVYLHATAELLDSVGRRFHSHFSVPSIIRRRNHAKQ